MAGPLGLLVGLLGSGGVRITCLQCGHRWRPGRPTATSRVSAIVVLLVFGFFCVMCIGLMTSSLSDRPERSAEEPRKTPAGNGPRAESPPESVSQPAAAVVDVPALAGLSAEAVDAIFGPPKSVTPITETPEEMPGEYRDYSKDGNSLTVYMYRGRVICVITRFEENPTTTVADAIHRVGLREEELCLTFQSPIDIGKLFIHRYQTIEQTDIRKIIVSRLAPGKWAQVVVEFAPAADQPSLAPEAIAVSEQEEQSPQPPRPKPEPPAMRTWTDTTGEHRVEAEFAGLVSGTVKLRKTDGRIIELPLEKLSQADQQWIRGRR